MRIKEFSIRRYGPLPDTGRVALGNFCLLFGKNEHGKTLTIDALIKLLLHRGRKHRKPFEDANIDRVDEDPDGYLIIEHEGKETKFSGKEDLADIPGVNSRDYRNIFIIRNSDLSVAQESDFYRDVTGRLTGLRTEEIALIKEQLQELGNLTTPRSTASLREKLKAKATNARKLIEEIEALETEAKQEQLDKLEEEILEIEEKASETSREIETLDNARKREKYEEGNKAYEALVSAHKGLEELKDYNDEDEKLWAVCEIDIKRYQEEIQKLQAEINAQQEKLEHRKKALGENRLEFQTLNLRKSKIDDEIKPEVKSYEMELGKTKGGERRNTFYTWAAIISAVLLTISLLGVIINPSPSLHGLLACFLILTGLFAWLKFSFNRDKGHLAGVFERIKFAASRFDLAAESPQEILQNIERFDAEYSKKQNAVEETERGASALEAQVRRWKETDIPEKGKQVRVAAEAIEKLSQKSKVETLQEYRKRLEQKSKYENLIGTQSGILESHFGSKGENLQENISYWHDEINALKEFEHKAEGISYAEKTRDQLRKEAEELQGEKRELESKLKFFRERLSDVEKKANSILELKDERLYCATSLDLKQIKAELSAFTDKLEAERENALEAIGIFEGLEREEEEKISTLFGKDSPISQHFSEITDGVYQEVEFAQDETKKIKVTLEDGNVLHAEQLSGAAYDQLYLSIRLALGEKLLKGSNGFFIMDDPFIKADKERLQRQIDILNRISKSGWQIIYFTAKDEVKDALKQDIENGNVSYMELPSILLHQNLGAGHTAESTSSPKTTSQTNQGELPL